MDKKTINILEFDKIIKKLEDIASSELGKEIASNLMPSRDIKVVSELLEQTNDGVEFILKKGNPPLGGIHNIKDSLKKAEIGGVLTPGEIMRIGDTLRAVGNLKKYGKDTSEKGENNNNVAFLIKELVGNKAIEEKIEISIVGEDEISDNASAALRKIRIQIKNEQMSIKDKLENIIKSSSNKKYMQDAIVTMRQDRYVIPVKQEYKNEIPGLVHDSSSSGATIFIEPIAVVDANNKIKQLQMKERDEIERILRELTNDIIGIMDSLLSNVEIFAQLDFIFAKAKLSLQSNCMCPRINNDGKIRIKNARHPLIDPKEVVPIDLWVGDEFKTLVITGPNTGGKTVTLKIVGLLTLMTQAGLHIPANEESQICVFEKVFADIGDEQSIEQSLSTFSSHMKNIINILKSSNQKSLVLFDELGAGTDPTEGAALAMSVLENMHQKGAVTIATTHYSELKVYAYSTQGVENACCEFDIKTLKPTFKLLIGLPGRSNAFAISKRLGMSDNVIDRAKEFLTGEELKFEDMLASIEKNKTEAQNEKLKTEILRTETEEIKKEVEIQKKKLEVQKENILKEAREQAKTIIVKAKEETEQLLEKLKSVEKEQESDEKRKIAEEVKNSIRSKLKETDNANKKLIIPKMCRNKSVIKLKQGDDVYIEHLDKKGTVINAGNANGEVTVQVGILKINVHASDLKIVEQQNRIAKTNNSTNTHIVQASNVKPELDLRGFMQDEAIIATDKYLDEVMMSGLHVVTIIHGKGTGALRKAVHNYLQSCVNVKSFRLGSYGEGDSGVTIVEMKI